MKDICDLEYMINSLYKKWRYHVGHTYEWQDKNEARFRDIIDRLEVLEQQQRPGLADPDPCAEGFCPVDLFRPIDETEGSV